MPLPLIQRGELWLVDLGYLGKVRPVLVISVPFQENERTLCIVIPHTTSLIGTRFEICLKHPALKAGAFDVQQTAAVQAAKFVRKLGTLSIDQLRTIELALADVLGLKLATSGDQPHEHCSGKSFWIETRGLVFDLPGRWPDSIFSSVSPSRRPILTRPPRRGRSTSPIYTAAP